MAPVTKRYQWAGPNLATVRSAIGPAATIKLGAVPFVELTYDDKVADDKAADLIMAREGFVPFTGGGATAPSFVLFSPDTSGFDVEVDNAGVLSTTKAPVSSTATPPITPDS